MTDVAMRNLLFLFIFLHQLKSVQAQEQAFAVWQGFEHMWSYNHRLNRLGDYIAQSPYKNSPHVFTAAHTGATGLGKDTAIFHSYFAEVKSKDLRFFPGVEKLKLEGRQGDLVQVSKKVFIIDSVLAKQSRLAVVFNGFDLVSVSGADKLQLLKIKFSDPVRRNNSDTIELMMEASIVADCKSFECDRFNKKFRYFLHLHYLVLGGQANQWQYTTTDYYETITWTRQKTAAQSSTQKMVHGIPGYSNAFLSFKNVFIVLNHDHWLLSIANAVTRSDYSPVTGAMRLRHIAYLQQWETGMKDVSSQSKFSEKRPGWGMLQGSMQLIQFHNGSVNYYERLGYIGWDGKNSDPNNDESVNRENRTIK